MKSLKGVFSLLIIFLFVGMVNVKAEDVANESELIDCLATEGETCTLTSDIETSATINITNDSTIDLNDYNITNTTHGVKVFDIKQGNVLITGNGTIESGAESVSAIRIYGSTNPDDTDYTSVTIDQNVTVVSDGYTVFITHNTKHAYGVTVDIYGILVTTGGFGGDQYGSFYTNGSFQDKTNYPVVNIHDGAILDSSAGGMGIYNAGYAEYNIGKADILATDAGIAVKSGIFNIDGVNIETTGEDTTPTAGYGDGINPSGAAIQIESNNGYAGDIELNLNSGTFISERGIGFYEYIGAGEETTVKSLDFKNIELRSGNGKPVFAVSDSFNANQAEFISGGLYSGSFNLDYLKDDYTINQVSNGYKVAKTVQDVDVPVINPSTPVAAPTVGIANASTVSAILIAAMESKYAEEIENINSTVNVTVNNNTDTTEENKEMVTEALKEIDSSIKVANYFEISLLVEDALDGSPIGALEELASPIEFAIALPEELQTVPEGYIRTFYVARIHNDEVEILDATLAANGKYVTFETDKFSTYALAYSDTKDDSATATADKATAGSNVANPDTADSLLMTLVIFLGSAAGLVITRKKLLSNKA